MTGPTAAQVAERDQADAAIREVEKAWPCNDALMDDDEVRSVVFERLGQAWPEDLPVSRSYLIFGHGRFVEVLSDPMVITALALKLAPRRGDCDRCHVLKPLAGVAVVAVPLNLVALSLCWDCADHLNPESLLQMGVSNA